MYNISTYQTWSSAFHRVFYSKFLELDSLIAPASGSCGIWFKTSTLIENSLINIYRQVYCWLRTCLTPISGTLSNNYCWKHDPQHHNLHLRLWPIRGPIHIRFQPIRRQFTSLFRKSKFTCNSCIAMCSYKCVPDGGD